MAHNYAQTLGDVVPPLEATLQGADFGNFDDCTLQASLRAGDHADLVAKQQSIASRSFYRHRCHDAAGSLAMVEIKEYSAAQLAQAVEAYMVDGRFCGSDDVQTAERIQTLVKGVEVASGFAWSGSESTHRSDSSFRGHEFLLADHRLSLEERIMVC